MSKIADASGSQKVAAINASAFAFQILAKLHPELKTRKGERTVKHSNFNYSTSSEISQQVLDNIKTKAAREYPDDFSTQKYLIDNEIESWVSLYNG